MADEDFQESLDKLLECPVCLESIEVDPNNLINLRQCHNGHITCSSCMSRLKKRAKCPKCRAPKANASRALLLEEILQIMPRPCKFSRLGCLHHKPKKSLRQHEESCGFRLLHGHDERALVKACLEGLEGIVKILLRECEARGLDLNIKHNDLTAFQAACFKGYATIVELFFKCSKRFDIDFKPAFFVWEAGWADELSMFHLACWKGHVEVVDVLLTAPNDLGIRLDIKTPQCGYTPFHLAAMSPKSSEMIQHLLKTTDMLQMCYQQRTKEGYTIFDLVCFHSNFETIDLLLSEASKNNVDLNVERTFINVCHKELYDTAVHLLERGISQATLNLAFVVACSIGSMDILQLLLEQDLDFNCHSLEFLPGFIVACSGNNVNAVELLIKSSREKGIDLNIKDLKTGATAFIYACELGHKTIVKMLLDCPQYIDFNATRTTDGLSGFQLACKNGHHEVGDAIISFVSIAAFRRPADNLKVDINGNNDVAFFLACKNGHFNVVQLVATTPKILQPNFNAKNENDISILYAAVIGKNPGIVHFLMGLEPEEIDFNAKNENKGRTAFHKACEDGSVAIVDCFLWASQRRDIDLNAKDDQGMTGFHLACEKGHYAVLQRLLEGRNTAKRIDINARDVNGNTGLIIAMQNRRSNIATLILNSGGKFNVKSSSTENKDPNENYLKPVKRAKIDFEQ